jgi:hypothetical protein
MVRRILGAVIDPLIRPLEDRIASVVLRAARTGPSTQIGLRHLYSHYRSLIFRGEYPRLTETGFRVFSQFDEDGKLLFIFAALGIPVGTFIDIGSGDGVNSNCANLALNFGWTGVFIDGNGENIRRGESFYASHPDSWAYPPKFVHAMVRRENINEILRKADAPPEPELMSIDIDGNDYWIWDAIECVTPKVVIIETHIEFGLRNIVVPYDPEYVYPGKHPEYHGASLTAMAKLANRRGYRLVGANNYGFNTIYVRRGLGEDVLPEVPPESILAHPRNAERVLLLEPIKDWKYLAG